jgi:hypothetical protein
MTANPDRGTVLSALTQVADDLSKEDWFGGLLKTEDVRRRKVHKNLSAHIESLQPADNLYRLGQDYVTSEEMLAKYKSIPRESIVTGIVAISITTALVVVAATISPFFYLLAFYALFLFMLPVALRDRWRKEEGVSYAPADKAKAATDLKRGMRSLIERSVREVIQPKFSRPQEDRVKVGDGAKLSTRVLESQRVATHYRPAIELHMLRTGGAAVGITGERGTGKSELLRSFCEPPVTGSVPEGEGTIGVIVAVPAAFEGLQFLMLVAERLARAVPGYQSPDEVRVRHRRNLAYIVASISLILLSGSALGLLLSQMPYYHWRFTSTDGWVIVGVTGIILYFVAIFLLRQSRRSFTRFKSGRRLSGRALKVQRSQVAHDAGRLMTRINFAETVTSQNQGSAGWGGISIQRSGQRTLSSLPLTEASLISEIKTLADKLAAVGYRTIIGIDEMDKLEGGKATDDFLNSIKQLFAVRSCSFLVTVSDSAWAKFVQRGINIRDALDSSLDAIEQIDALDFGETRSLLRHRDRRMSDSEVLFCYVVSGGLPREALRCAQSLAMRNSKEDSSHKLGEMAGWVLDKELDRLIDASKRQVSGWKGNKHEEVIRKLDDILQAWQSRPANNATASSLANGRPASGKISSRPSKGNLTGRLELMVLFYDVVRELFCGGASASRVSEFWEDGIIDIADRLAAIRRDIESDPTVAQRGLKAISREFHEIPISKAISTAG